MNRFGLALRSELYTGKELLDFAKLADRSMEISHLFFPDNPRGSESIELSAASLAVTERLKIGSGVLRPLEHDPGILARRLETIQNISGNRFVFGIGVGNPGPRPSEMISRMFSHLEATKERFLASSGFSTHKMDTRFPEVFIAALRPRMARKSINLADGLLLNFCSPDYAKRLISELQESETASKQVIMACYVKVFFAKEQQTANRLLVEEFVKYDNLPQYHGMFEEDGVASLIESSRERLDAFQKIEIPDRLKEISLSNPTNDELHSFLLRFTKAGIDLPCVYPYFTAGEKPEYKLEIMNSILEALRSDDN